MKAFEVWIKKQKYLGPNYFLGAEAAWKAALECILNNYGNFAKLEDLRDFIQEELEQ